MITDTSKNFHTIIVGGGASGLMAAVVAGRKGAKVLLLEQKERLGKKILATGNGKCNFTNADMTADHFHGDPALIAEVLRQFDEKDTLSFFHEIGIYPKSRDGYYYPASGQASSVADALAEEILRYPVTVRLNTAVTDIRKEKEIFAVTAAGEVYTAPTVLIACGLKANPKLGSDGRLLPLLERLGHHLNPVLPALCGFYAEGFAFRDVNGIRTEAVVSLYVKDHYLCSDHGEIQLTDYGISGIPVFQISSAAVKALNAHQKCTVSLDFLPQLKGRELKDELNFRIQRSPKAELPVLLNGLLPGKLVHAILKATRIPEMCTGELLSAQQKTALLQQIKDTRVSLIRPRDYEFAQVCTGGIPPEEIRFTTMESRIVKGLYLSGEILDVDGICGGYNLQWAWSTGYIAGNHLISSNHSSEQKRKQYDPDQSDKTSGSSQRRRTGRKNPENFKIKKQ